MSPRNEAHLPDPAEVKAELAVLSAEVDAADRSGPLDGSYASLDRVEDYFGAAADNGGESLVRRVEWYVGTTLVESAHGVWTMSEDVGGRWRPHIGQLPELGDYAFLPALVVNQFMRTRRQRVLRDWTEVYDVPYRRQATDHLLAKAATELAALQEDIREVTGKSVKLDLSMAKLDVVQEMLTQLVGGQASRDRVRAVQERAMLQVGAVFKSKVKRATWKLCVEPENEAIGQLLLDDFAPLVVIRKISARNDRSFLREIVAEEIEARRS